MPCYGEHQWQTRPIPLRKKVEGLLTLSVEYPGSAKKGLDNCRRYRGLNNGEDWNIYDINRNKLQYK